MAVVDYLGEALSISDGMLSSVSAPGAGVGGGGHLLLILQKLDVSGSVLHRTWAGPLRAGQKACQGHLHEDPLLGVLSIPVVLLPLCNARCF